MQFSTRINVTPSASFTTDGAIYSIDYSPFEDKFITAGRQLCLWDVERSEIVQNFKWGNDDIIFAKYSPNEPNLIITTQYDNSITFYDLRVGNAVQKLTLNMRSNAARFNPMKPYMFAVANDDSNVYSFDFRNFTKAKTIHAGFVNAALDVEFSPLGTELVAGSFDQTVRIWKADSPRSREIYHNKRMQAAFQVRYTHDSKYILTGSADMNVRLWKSEASMLERIPSVREKKSLQYRNALKEKYAHMPEISKILTKRQLPKYIYNQTKVRYVHSQAEKRKEENRIKNDPKNAERQPLHKSMISKVAFEGQKRHELNEFANEDEEEDFIEEPPSDFSDSD
uniref:Protein SOF1-like n=1 Tax=Dermatophagoides pteronyssinus TaxID=6956 RepID=A0A6P6XME0_DERPT|nr:protein SOF1-like [Dermatophagoides pteronyssinus]